MKTKFGVLVQAQKKKLDMCEMQIVRHNNEIAAINNQITTLISDIAQMQTPKQGSVDVLLHEIAHKKAYLFEIDTLREAIANLKAKIKALETEYRGLYIEFEKLKYLQEREHKNMLKAIKARESKELDEIAILLHKKERI